VNWVVLDGSGEAVTVDKGQGLKKLSSFVHFWNPFPLISAHVYITHDRNVAISSLLIADQN
jgi:hypothetical protein